MARSSWKNRFRITIKLAMAVVLFAGAGLATLRDPSMWRVGGVVACLIRLELTACVGALYRTGRKRGFSLGIVVFGGPRSALSRRLVRFDGEPGTRGGAIVLLAQPVVIVGHRLGILDGAAAILLHVFFRRAGQILKPL